MHKADSKIVIFYGGGFLVEHFFPAAVPPVSASSNLLDFVALWVTGKDCIPTVPSILGLTFWFFAIASEYYSPSISWALSIRSGSLHRSLHSCSNFCFNTAYAEVFPSTSFISCAFCSLVLCDGHSGDFDPYVAIDTSNSFVMSSSLSSSFIGKHPGSPVWEYAAYEALLSWVACDKDTTVSRRDGGACITAVFTLLPVRGLMLAHLTLGWSFAGLLGSVDSKYSLLCFILLHDPTSKSHQNDLAESHGNITPGASFSTRSSNTLSISEFPLKYAA